MSNEIIIYTDGSCMPNPGKGGWAYIALFDNCELHCNGFSENTTNNIMELTAVIEALKDFKDFKKITIYTDSRYVIECAKGKWQRKKNLELWTLYDSLSKKCNIQFIWVKGHNGDKYNELVDILAKQSIK